MNSATRNLNPFEKLLLTEEDEWEERINSNPLERIIQKELGRQQKVEKPNDK